MLDGSNVPSDWIIGIICRNSISFSNFLSYVIEFSDPIFGNRWKRDEIYLIVLGRVCSSPVHSQHDRRYF